MNLPPCMPCNEPLVTIEDLRIKPGVPRCPKKQVAPPTEALFYDAAIVQALLGEGEPDNGRSIKPAVPTVARPTHGRAASVRARRPHSARPATQQQQQQEQQPPSFSEWTQTNLWALGGMRGKVPPPPPEFLLTPRQKRPPEGFDGRWPLNKQREEAKVAARERDARIRAHVAAWTGAEESTRETDEDHRLWRAQLREEVSSARVAAARRRRLEDPVSYTHLTLPTICSV